MKKTPLHRTKGIRKVSDKTKRLNERYSKLRVSLIANRALNKCEYCGKSGILHCHHIEFRSHGRDDSKENLIVLCQECHRQAHIYDIKRQELLDIVKERNHGYSEE